jgi:hypothetical protein
MITVMAVAVTVITAMAVAAVAAIPFPCPPEIDSKVLLHLRSSAPIDLDDCGLVAVEDDVGSKNCECGCGLNSMMPCPFDTTKGIEVKRGGTIFCRHLWVTKAQHIPWKDLAIILVCMRTPSFQIAVANSCVHHAPELCPQVALTIFLFSLIISSLSAYPAH